MTSKKETTAVEIYYADQARCDQWDAELLACNPSLATATEPWRTEPGWYWYGTVHGTDLQEGPFASQGEAQADADRAMRSPLPHQIIAALDKAIDED
jgi:hypothetical protein